MAQEIIEELDDLRRQERRQKRHSIVIRYSSQDGSARQETHECNTEDISAGGLKLVIQRPLPLGCVLPVIVQASKPDSRFEFLGEVKWCLEVDEVPTYFIGIKLLQIIENSYENWVSLASH
ncbi:PilZ domain-containing protein [Aliikangiella coralliicola]|uniref:PilZ domain-containing protein n=1 Tax=Aliikangiella coralliicola TaxID=2592383 RepID=A0A545U4T1_9GAMM|nr:PilZ domain-containing protein [Aliikangiella coralliicola]TQV84480.1 PilZ domain-containing protein [Aliikangiella coralliicola]